MTTSTRRPSSSRPLLDPGARLAWTCLRPDSPPRSRPSTGRSHCDFRLADGPAPYKAPPWSSTRITPEEPAEEPDFEWRHGADGANDLWLYEQWGFADLAKSGSRQRSSRKSVGQASGRAFPRTRSAPSQPLFGPPGGVQRKAKPPVADVRVALAELKRQRLPLNDFLSLAKGGDDVFDDRLYDLSVFHNSGIREMDQKRAKRKRPVTTPLGGSKPDSQPQALREVRELCQRLREEARDKASFMAECFPAPRQAKDLESLTLDEDPVKRQLQLIRQRRAAMMHNPFQEVGRPEVQTLRELELRKRESGEDFVGKFTEAFTLKH